MPTLNVRLQIYMNKKNTQNLLKLQIFLFFSEKKRNICNFNNFFVCFFIHIYMYIHIYNT